MNFKKRNICPCTSKKYTRESNCYCRPKCKFSSHSNLLQENKCKVYNETTKCYSCNSCKKC